jgi:uncharacterized protein YndB with AHSA1/START domain
MKRISLMVSLVALSFVFFSSFAQASEQVRTFTVENSVVINAQVQDVFEFAANPLNDVQWRSEVNTMTASGPWEVGTIYYEDSRLGIRPHYVTPTVMTELEPPHRMVVETPEDNLYLKATRTFEPLDDGRTMMTYRLDVDLRMPVDVTGLYLPRFFVELYYNHVMRVYLSRLRYILENE